MTATTAVTNDAIRTDAAANAVMTISGTPAGGATRVPRPSGTSGSPAVY